MPIQETNKELVEKPVGILQEEEKEEPILSHTEDEDDDDDDDEDEDDKINKVIWQFNILELSYQIIIPKKLKLIRT